MRFQMSKSPIDQATWDKAQAAIKSSVESYDFDSNDRAQGQWMPTPADKVVHHNLQAMPKTVHVYAADAADGTGMIFDTWTAADRTTLTVNGTKAYCRVLINL